MAKRLLLSILDDILGNYVDGLTTENLKIGVWSGKIEFNNLDLKRNALDGLHLPISISHGTLSHLKVKIPWTHLETKPVKVTIDGVYLQAGPLDVSKLNPNDIKASVLLNKHNKLVEAENLLVSSDAEGKRVANSKSSSSYIQQLTMKIISNIEITLTNIHIRYEDNKISIANRCISAGIFLSTIRLSSANEFWKDIFDSTSNISDTKKSNAQADVISSIIRKLGLIDSVGIYWNTNELNPLDSLNSAAWKETMKKHIFHSLDKSSISSMLEYVLLPSNSLSAKIMMRQKSTNELPLLDLMIESSMIKFNFEKVQYQQLLGVIATFSQLERYKEMELYRPKIRPTVDPKQWWKYAFKLVLGKDLSLVASPIDTMILCKKLRTRYMQLLKQNRVAGGPHLASTSVSASAYVTSRATNILRLDSSNICKLSFSEINELDLNDIEEILPFQALLLFRQFAALEVLKEKDSNKINSKSVAGKSKADTKNSRSLFSWMKLNKKARFPDDNGNIII